MGQDFTLTKQHDILSKIVFNNYKKIPKIEKLIKYYELTAIEQNGKFPDHRYFFDSPNVFITLEKQILGFNSVPIAKIDAEVYVDSGFPGYIGASDETKMLGKQTFVIEIKPKIDSFIQFLGQMNKYKEIYQKHWSKQINSIGIFWECDYEDAQILKKHGIECYICEQNDKTKEISFREVEKPI